MNNLKQIEEYIWTKSNDVEINYINNWGIFVKYKNNHYLFYNTTPVSEAIFLLNSTNNNKRAMAFTDGSGTTKDKSAGIGVAIYSNFYPIYIAENIGEATNNIAELLAIWRALRQFPLVDTRIHICSDSEYAIGILTKDWKASSNSDIVQSIREDITIRNSYGGNITFEHVDGHAGIQGNEIADKLANIGRKIITEKTVYL